ncbi:MAG: chromate resistance protein ChrB domain-containing protein [Dongiaceae bacterium]
MGDSVFSISIDDFRGLIGTRGCPIIVDVRRPKTFADSDVVIPTARWRDLQTIDRWVDELPADADIVAYCVHGYEMSQSAVAQLRARGRRAVSLAGGLDAYREGGGPVILKRAMPGRDENLPSRWITRERPKIDRIACPWLIRRFIDRDARLLFVGPEHVAAAAQELAAVPYDIPGVEFSHDGPLCSFDAFLKRFGLADPALDRLATIIRSADTGHPELAPEAPGLLAMSLGLSAICPNDHEMLEQGMVLYDALYGWARHAAAETHGWPPR